MTEEILVAPITTSAPWSIFLENDSGEVYSDWYNHFD